jgi:signal transduction histidine kinase
VSLRTRLILVVAYVLLLALVALGIPLTISLRDRVNAEVRSQARSQADVLAATAAGSLEPAHTKTLDRIVRVSGRSVRGRVIVVNRAGRVVADSAGRGELGRDYRNRPEVATALHGADYQQDRASRTLGGDILATATPVIRAGRPIGAVRVTQSVGAVDDAISTAIVGLAVLGGVVLALGLLAGALLAAQIARPIRRLENAARRVAEGDLEASAPVEGSSEQRSLARSFNEMTSRVGRLLESQQAFVADASHQLRTPLTGIRLQLEELRETASDDDDRAAALDAGMREVDRLSHIVDELLILSRAGEHELPAERVDLLRLAARGAERWRKTAAEHGIELRLESNGAPPPAWAAVPDLDRALDALVENAIVYSPEGGEVVIAVGPTARIEVLDRGPGLVPGEEEVVFERFARGQVGRGGAAGTGLGLAIARELAGQWGAAVELASREGGGTVATISWPLNGDGRGGRS